MRRILTKIGLVSVCALLTGCVFDGMYLSAVQPANVGIVAGYDEPYYDGNRYLRRDNNWDGRSYNDRRYNNWDRNYSDRGYTVIRRR